MRKHGALSLTVQVLPVGARRRRRWADSAVVSQSGEVDLRVMVAVIALAPPSGFAASASNAQPRGAQEQH
ncbi:hypothetical protein [Streptomyces sp. HD]|uniref:hypothetical protein n=1 Tax=Streptomyces sp. HD TaxID=3020892 RepID=UPI00232EC3B7|nr:hypothetical protein [Streptomyces sp. HD]MDC0771462.1 hypothetical protein [Streptomyces sp. HD]